MKIKILYEDSDILAIDKPSGVAVHPDGKSGEETISDWFLKKYPEAKDVGEPIFVEGKEIKRPGVVHRLDRETSGVLLLAKNKKAHEFLKSQFSASALEIAKRGLADKQNRVKKIYVAIVEGLIKKDHDIIDKPIGRSPRDFRRRLAGRGARGEMREAVTEYKVLKRVTLPLTPSLVRAGESSPPSPLSKKIFWRGGSKGGEGVFTYLEISPKTGRTHQIRAHMKFINHPIVGDKLYNPRGEEGRMMLHALSIEFKNLKGETVKVKSPLPEEFERVLK